MDQIKIGKFIAQSRKKQKLTQMQLADKLGITDKAVSKWERGITMPDTSIMLALCDILNIRVEELLCGERINMESENQKNEQLLLDMVKELEQKEKTVWTSMWVIMGISMAGLAAGILVEVFLIPQGIWQLVTIVGICVLFLISCIYAVKLEASVGYYQCQKCGEKIVPTFSDAMKAKHRGFTRHLLCPNCGKRTWCKKIVKK